MHEKIDELLQNYDNNPKALKSIREAIKEFSKYYHQSNQLIYLNELPDIEGSIEKIQQLNDLCIDIDLPLFYDGDLISFTPSNIALIDTFICSLVREKLLILQTQ